MASPMTDQKIYKYHVTNLRAVQTAINNTALSTRKAISEENQPATRSFTSLYSFLIGAWAENRLKKVIFEDGGMSKDERRCILCQGTQLEQWSKAIEVAIRKHYNIPHAEINNSSLTFTALSRYTALNELLQTDIQFVIEIRNRLAHGQWIYPFNNDGTDIEQEKYRYLKEENLQSLQFKFKLISSIADIIHDLIVSLPTFERDFDHHFRIITHTRSNLKNRKYDDYKQSLIENRRRGIIKRKSSRT